MRYLDDVHVDLHWWNYTGGSGDSGIGGQKKPKHDHYNETNWQENSVDFRGSGQIGDARIFR